MPVCLRATLSIAMTQLPLLAQSSWVQITPSGPAPSARFGHGMAYDSQRGKTVLFGGYGLGDTWEWDGAAWSQVATSGPPARYGFGMAYDSQRARTVVYGGIAGMGGSYLSDTWEWDGSTWTMVSNAGPSATPPYAMTYDSQRGKLVLSDSSQNGPSGFRGTFEWSGSGWAYVGTSGPGYAAAMAYDSHRGRTILLGGYTTFASEWDGNTWQPVTSGFPGPVFRAYTAMAFDSQRDTALMCGGYTTGVFYDETWAWNGSNWAQMPGPAAGARGWHAMAYDTQRGRVVLFGGQGPGGASGDLLEWVGGNGQASQFGSGCGNPALALQGGSPATVAIGSTMVATLTNVPSPWAFVALGWSRTHAGPFQLPVPLDGYGMTGCLLLQSAESIGQSASIPVSGTATYELSVPLLASLIGVHLYAQGWAVAPGANPANIIVSNGLDWLIGY